MKTHHPLLLALALGAGLPGAAPASPITLEFTGSVSFHPDGGCSACPQIYTDFTRDSGLSASGTSTITGTVTFEQDATPYPYGGAPGLYGTAVISATLQVGRLAFTSAHEPTGYPDAAYGSGQVISLAPHSMLLGIGNDSPRWWGETRLGSEHVTSAVNPRMAYYWRGFSTSLANNVSTLFSSVDLIDLAGQLDALDLATLTTRSFLAGIEFIDPTYPYGTDGVGDPLYYHYNPSLSLSGLLTGLRVLPAAAPGGGGSGAGGGTVPEPGTVALLGLSLAALAWAGRRPTVAAPSGLRARA